MKWRLPFGPGYRAEPPGVPQPFTPAFPIPRNLTRVTPSGDSWREHRAGDIAEVDGWNGAQLYYGMGDGGMNYGPPPRINLFKAFEIPRLFRASVQGWAGLQQIAFTQDQRGGAKGYGAHIPHPPYLYPGRGLRSISMIRKNTNIKAADRLHVPAIFVPTAPLS